jgi:NitT/TauT family transport system substrate-binding protein
VATEELNIMKKYTKPDGFDGPLGDVDLKRVNTIIALLEQYHSVEKGSVKADDVVTMSLAPKA